MRIGIVAPEFPPDIGGVETYSFELARALASRGHRVTVFTVPHPEGEITLPGIELMPILRQRRRTDRAILTDYPMDVWHATNAAYAWLAMEANNVVVSVHGNDFLRPYIDVGRPEIDRLPGLWRFASQLVGVDRRVGRWLTRRLVDRALPRVPHLLANSCYTQAALLRKYPACRPRVTVGLVGVGQDFLDSTHVARTPGEPARLMTASRLSEPRKNVDVVLRALAALKDRFAFTYTVVGDGKLRPQLETLTRQLKLQDRVRFTGRLSTPALRQHMASSDLFILASSILPTSHEGFGIAYLEANACGTPVLAARLAGAVEAVTEGVSGMFVDVVSIPALQSALTEFLAGKVPFRAEACREHARQFGWDRVADHVLSCYERVMLHFEDPTRVTH